VTTPAIVGGLFDLLVGIAVFVAVANQGSLALDEPLPPLITRTLTVMGLLYFVAGVMLLIPRRDSYHGGRWVLIAGIAVNIFFAIGAGFSLPRDVILDYPLLVAAPGFILGLTLLEAIFLFWPDETPRS